MYIFLIKEVVIYLKTYS